MEPWSLTISADLSRYYITGDLEDEQGYGIAAIEPAAYDPSQGAGVSTMKFSTLVSLIRLGPDGQTMYIIEPYEETNDRL